MGDRVMEKLRMEGLSITFAPLSEAKQTVCLAFSEAKGGFSPALKVFDSQTKGLVARAATIAKFTGAKKTSLDLIAPAGLDLERLIIMGLGTAERYNDLEWMSLGGRIRARLTGARVTVADILLEASVTGAVNGRQAACVAMGFLLRGYEFKKYKKKKKEESEDEAEPGEIKSIRVLCAQPEEAKAHFEGLRPVADGVMLARDLVNEPPNVLGPEEFADRAKPLTSLGLDVEVLDKARLEEIGMGALLAVGQGSARPSCVVVMKWNGARDATAKPLVLIGKGVVFDTGGISIKPAAGMEEMKGDMAGAAAVIGAMKAIAERKAKANVIGFLGLTENMPSGTAQRPGDIVTSLSGQTIEVINTDAEGRLVLADVMWYAQEQYQPAGMVTLATLTGAIIVALGKEHAGLFCNDGDLAKNLTTAGQETGEKVWQLPLDAKYDKQINSKTADMKNVGGRDAGSITAAQFLQRFVKDGTPWAHLDIAGTAMSSPQTDINQGWASGFGVMLLDRLVGKFYEDK
jgi:leucyl aminopeptidase